MAQITEKRTTSARSGTAAKENHSLTGQHNHHNQGHQRSGKGIEILDFHESWLEEVELYKDKMVMCKKLAHHNHMPAAAHHLQPHLSAPNRNQGRVVQPTTPQHRSSAGGGSISGAASASISLSASARSSPPGHKQRSPPSPRKRLTPEKVTVGLGGGASKVAGQRIVIRGSPPNNSPPKVAVTASSAAPFVANSVLQSEPYKKVQMLLKRAREEVLSKNSPGFGNGGKRSSLSPPNQVDLPSSSMSCPSTQTLKPSQTSKIVVNSFHGSSMLSAQQQEEKSRLLTQNGLTKSAASALETSLYASLYAHPPQNTQHQFHHQRISAGDHSPPYVGVSLNKGIGHDHDRKHEDDPCAAIDDINNYDDSDSEEEYVGTPFFLEEDNTETRQSKHTRLLPEKTQSKESVATTDSEASVYFRPGAILSPSLFPHVPPYLNFTSHADKGPPMPAALHRVLKWKLSPVMPKIVKRVVLNSGFRIIKNTTDWMAVWEKHMKSPGFRTIRSHQKYNHIPGSFRIGRKDTMWRSIYNNMKKFGKKEFGFMQKSYIMPDDLESLRQVWPKNASKLTKWIVKPPASARGTGIRIVNKWSQFPKDRPLVVQKYIERPLLINDNKFDMRLYVVLTSINPLRIYMYKDGLARFASVKYSSELSNLDERCMHLTNYSINKFSQNYAKNEDFNACQGHKWTLQSLWSCLENRGVNTKRLWATLRNLVIKGIVSGESGLNRMYRQNVNFRYNCFELFGFDVLLDENLVPWLLEINISPSLHSELPLDLHVKGPLIQAVLNTALYQVPPKLNERQQTEILEELNLAGPLCHDKRIFTTCLTAEEVRKHNQYTNRSIEFREEYVDTILDNLLPDDVRCLIVAEDELARCHPLERIFPTSGTHIYLRYVENARYYNRLLDAWETKFAKNREMGIALLSRYCRDKYHLQVSDAAMEKEPNVALTEIDMLHVRKDEVLDGATTLAMLKPTAVDSSELVVPSPDASIEVKS
ncbi:LOW QUALITY PROTEIN: tubulin polyglutamylase ttll-4 [Drosophila eugracilis]|uniref:LOW QUALITY PROTEIN: tubulin polyglutamylase ttll-4 n=1 Tax=Drosophila eugracilis TaxID=29029 RepID=UPI001BDAAB2C|nr:LOW QUALITY PROTEIN: tubulin polyglutamylase ttll-4 [Drosophila eugracilis]